MIGCTCLKEIFKANILVCKKLYFYITISGLFKDFIKSKLISFSRFLNTPVSDTFFRLNSSLQDLSNIPWHVNLFYIPLKAKLEQGGDLISIQVS